MSRLRCQTRMLLLPGTWSIFGLSFGVGSDRTMRTHVKFIGVPTPLEVAILGFPRTRKGENGPLLELVEYAEPLSTGVQPVPGNVGFAHLCLFVDEIHDEYRRLSEQGVVFRSQPVRITAGMNEGGYVCYFVDPDGNGLEFFQPPDVASRQAMSAPPMNQTRVASPQRVHSERLHRRRMISARTSPHSRPPPRRQLVARVRAGSISWSYALSHGHHDHEACASPPTYSGCTGVDECDKAT